VLPFTAFEQSELPTDHAVIGCLLAQNWWLPDEIYQAIRHHHELASIATADSGVPLASRYLIAIGQTAEHLLQQVRRVLPYQGVAQAGGCVPAPA
jgi:HD-like signal output (HDOD) protein